MEIPSYEYRESPTTALHPVDVAKMPAHFGQGLARSLVIGGRMLEEATGAEGDLEASRIAVRAAQFRLGVDQMAAEAQESPNLDLTPEQAQQQFVTGAMQRTQDFAKTIRNERLRNRFLADEMGRIGSHSIQIRHATAKAWHDDNVARAGEVADANVSRFALTADAAIREQIQAETFGLYDDLVQHRHLSAVRSEGLKKQWRKKAEMGAWEHDGLINPEETLRDLFRETIDERGETVFEHGDLTWQERSAVAHNIRASQAAQDAIMNRQRKRAEEDDRKTVMNAVTRGQLGGLRGVPFDWRALDQRMASWSEEAQNAVRTHVQSWLKTGGQEADPRASREYKARLMTGIHAVSDHELTKRRDEAENAIDALTDEHRRDVVNSIDAERKRRTDAAGIAATREEAAEARRQKRERARMLNHIDSILPKGEAHSEREMDAWNDSYEYAQRVGEMAILSKQDPIKAVDKARPEIESRRRGGVKESAKSQHDQLKKYRFPGFELFEKAK